MNMKKCSKCKIEKNFECFYTEKKTKDGYSCHCKDCVKSRAKQYYDDNREQKINYQRTYIINNKEAIQKYHRQYCTQEENKSKRRDAAKRSYVKNVQKRKEYSKAYKAKNRQKIQEHENYKRKNNTIFRIKCTLRSRLSKYLFGKDKSGSAVRDLGCSVPELKIYLESKFQPGMTWENYGYYGWHIDHIIPLASFDLIDREQILRACHYTNLQPLWAEENLSKGSKILGEI